MAVVLPFEEGKQFQTLARASDLHVVRQLAFYSRQGKPQERWLFEFSFLHTEIVNENLILHATGEDWSVDYKKLTRDFYLDL